MIQVHTILNILLYKKNIKKKKTNKQTNKNKPKKKNAMDLISNGTTNFKTAVTPHKVNWGSDFF